MANMTRVTIEDEGNIGVFPCKDCGEITENAAAFSEHTRVCKVNPISLPQAEIERREAESVDASPTTDAQYTTALSEDD